MRRTVIVYFILLDDQLQTAYQAGYVQHYLKGQKHVQACKDRLVLPGAGERTRERWLGLRFGGGLTCETPEQRYHYP